jgi:hypothetical protein
MEKFRGIIHPCVLVKVGELGEGLNFDDIDIDDCQFFHWEKGSPQLIPMRLIQNKSEDNDIMNNVACQQGKLSVPRMTGIICWLVDESLERKYSGDH